MRLRTKFTIAFVSIIVLLGAAVGLFIIFSYSQKLTDQLQEKGFSIARDLGLRTVDDILTADIVSLYKLVNDVTKVEEDVYYAYILSSKGKILVHTFEGGFPKGLLTANPVSPNQEESTQLLDTEEGFIRDIAVPIMDGSLGTLHVGVSENRIRSAVAAGIRRLILITGVILLVGIAVTHVLIRRIVMPISDITMAAQQIGEGNLDTRVKVSSKDEIGKLGHTFNLMASKLKKANEDLENVQEQLVEARKMASIGHFASGVAHEINNPLGGALNCTRTLLSSPGIKEEKRQYLELILKALIRIESVIKQLLTFSIQRKIETRPVKIDDVVKETLEFMEHRLREQKVRLANELPSSLPEIMADPSQLQQVFMNIIKNALDAMPSGGKLSIKATATDSTIIMEFIDTGYGIKKEDIPRIFDPFFTTKEIGKGVGLGLAVSYGIIQQHAGVMLVKSKQGEGTIVSILLPIKKGANGKKEIINSRR